MTIMHTGSLVVSALLIVGVLLSGSSCSKEPTGPIPGPDTTSHDFSWTIVKLGDGASSILRDVTIINDTLAYAVGAVYVKDSTGNWDPFPYNVAKWNGKAWELLRVSYSDYGVPRPPPLPGPLYAVYALGANEIYAASSANLLRWDGVKWEERAFFMTSISWNGRVRKIWGTDARNLLCAGENGALYHVDVTTGSWTSLQSGTILDIRDIYGARNPQTGSWEIMATASQQYTSFERRIMRIKGLTVEALADSPITEALTTCWFIPGSRYYVAGSGIFEKGSLDEAAWQRSAHGVAHYYTEAIRGSAANDIITVGDFGEVLHYSGRTWKNYAAQTGMASGAYYAVAVRGDRVIAVGVDSPRAVVLMGTRVP
jgi:hypothetical protein